MDSTITPEMIQEARTFLIDNPIDHQYDDLEDVLDNDMPPLQVAARGYKLFLQLIGELPTGT